MKRRDPWTILGLPRGATPAQIKGAYRALARELHPDRNAGDETKTKRFQDVAWAYEALTDPKKRVEFEANAAAAFDDIIGTLFGDEAGELVDRIRGEGIGSHNIDSLINSFGRVAQEAHAKMPDAAARTADRAKNMKPSEIFSIFERAFSDPNPKKKR
jgi:molecular chaperone DnaJ